ncbi:SP0191 family lipoprotein [Streptococcus merionis]|uniref:SP0191 family lipoprotein n=1 Tax=Streptococcus merionis TaxID=400065 RepID=UPI0026EFDF6D|nr:SP0191 family lipoprotein [Streptococcus merionis]
MKKIGWALPFLVMVCLIGCSPKEKSTSTETSTSEEAVVKTQVFDIEMANGQKQQQTVVYKGDVIQKLGLKNSLPATEEITKAIDEVGIEETKRIIQESMSSDEAYRSLEAITGLEYELQFDEQNNMYLLFTLDVPNLDIASLAQSDIFKGSGLEDIKTLTAEKYLKRLETYGAQPVTSQSNETDQNDLSHLKKY